MTLPASYPLSMSQIATELGRTLPLSLLDSWVIVLAGKSGAPVSFGDLLGKTGRIDGNFSVSTTGIPTNIDYLNLSSHQWFGGGLATQSVSQTKNNGAGVTSIQFTVSPNWTGKISVKNNTTGVSGIFSMANSTTWQTATNLGTNFLREAFTDSFTILPSN
ncbi:MAG: hypothetical protein ACTHK9_05025 [Nitrobacter sp.]